MKRLTTIILAVAFMIAGVSAAFMDYNPPSNKTMMAATIPEPLQWNTKGLMPLDLQLDLDKRLSHETPTAEPERIVDTVYVDKIKWKTRYKTVAARTTAREVGEHMTTATPDSMAHAPTIIGTLEREEQPNDFEESPNGPSIQLTVDGVIVYQSEDVIHSTEESQ